jgi:hypothetical protein
VTDAFARLLRRLGVVLHQAGTPTDHRGFRTPYRVNLRESAASLSARSAAVRELFARRALAYRPFSMLDEETNPILESIRPFLPPLAAAARPRADAGWSRLGPEIWGLETERTRPGPGVWRTGAARTRPGPGVWGGAS